MLHRKYVIRDCDLAYYTSLYSIIAMNLPCLVRNVQDVIKAARSMRRAVHSA